MGSLRRRSADWRSARPRLNQSYLAGRQRQRQQTLRGTGERDGSPRRTLLCSFAMDLASLELAMGAISPAFPVLSWFGMCGWQGHPDTSLGSSERLGDSPALEPPFQALKATRIVAFASLWVSSPTEALQMHWMPTEARAPVLKSNPTEGRWLGARWCSSESDLQCRHYHWSSSANSTGEVVASPVLTFSNGPATSAQFVYLRKKRFYPIVFFFLYWLLCKKHSTQPPHYIDFKERISPLCDV